jgi:NADH dehydrogenase (ubiquinone) Fe-S protein 5
MASGFGVKGTRGRCHAFWQDFSACMSTADTPSACFALREDYLECLHHRKEVRAPRRGAARCGRDAAARSARPLRSAPRKP